MAERDDLSHKEYIQKRDTLVLKRKQWDDQSEKELKKIDAKKEKYQQLLNTLQSKRDQLNSKLQDIHKTHVEFLRMERKKGDVLLKLEDNKKRLEQLLTNKIEADLHMFNEGLKHLDERHDKPEYDRVRKRIRISTVKKQDIEAKLESIVRTIELNELKALDLNECNCVF
eukprot:396949_1